MNKYKTLIKGFVTIIIPLVLIGCGGGGGATTASNPDGNTSVSVDDEFSRTEYKGLVFYYKNMPSSAYRLNQLTDSEFNALDSDKQLQIANKLLNSLFFGYPLKILKEKIKSDSFLSTLRSGLDIDSTDKEWLENHILDDTVFRQFQSPSYEPQAITILTRFYAMQDLDKYFLQNWIAYILTQTIMFSPAYELSSTHTPNISRVYNRLVTMLENESGMRFITYVHMMSEDNWRRFRSPEDNGREMLEIYLLDADDTHVPLAGKALQNWKLNTDSDTLEVGLNRNTTPLSLFGTTVYNGDDFYRELAKSNAFTSGVTSRLVDFFFPEKSSTQKASIVSSIVSSKPETWQDILLQILFSEEYLLNNNRAQSAEETFFSLTKKVHFRNRRSTFYYLKEALEDMHQATMKYKLGKLERVPLDTLSFAHYHKNIRENILLQQANPEQDDPDSWNYDGWQADFISFDKFTYNSNSDTESLKGFVDYLFESTVARQATTSEQQLFKEHMIESRDGKQLFRYEFNMFVTYDDLDIQHGEREERKGNIAIIVLDYISRLDLTYRQREVH
jgi:hypothetical protein